jgi:ribonuclease P protein component
VVASLSFPPALRLHQPFEYRSFRAGARCFKFAHCLIFQIPNRYAHPRLGITLKVRARSIDRNRTKRAIREAFRHNAKTLGAFDYNVVVGGKRALTHPFPQILGGLLREELPRLVRG